MAENQNSPDQTKIASEAKDLASGGTPAPSPNTGTGNDAGTTAQPQPLSTGNPGEQTNQVGTSATAPTGPTANPQAASQEAKQGRGPGRPKRTAIANNLGNDDGTDREDEFDHSVAGVPANKPAENAGSFQPSVPSNVAAAQPQTIIAQIQTKPAETISEEDAERIQREKLEAFGPDYVDAQKGNEKQTFSRRAWDLLGPYGKDGTKDGWATVVKKPQEVKDLEKSKADQ